MTIIRNIFHGFLRAMSSNSKIPIAPVGVRGMRDLDRTKFSLNVILPVLKVREEKLSKISNILKQYFLKLENFKPVQAQDAVTKCVYFNPEKITQWNEFSEKDKSIFQEHNIDHTSFSLQSVQLSYDNFKIDTIFKAVLPENEETVSGFSQIGHIIHLNLREHLHEYRHLIGQVLLDKIKTCKTVVNKSNIIDNTYRNFKMEVVAGTEDYFVTVKENRCNFQFDFSKVYWNPRLGKEHERILSFLNPNDVLFDVFCGVGPFAVPAARRKCTVFANDLNPDSFKWLNHNAKHNKVNMNIFRSYNLDGKDFICDIFQKFVSNICDGTEKLKEGAKIHVTMNLPAMAVEFLKHFNGLLRNKENTVHVEIIAYVYCFAIGDDPASVAKKMVSDNIGRDISTSILDVFNVRNVSPKKEMMRATIRLNDVIFNELQEPPTKKVCV
ncbi:tRNA (guanine(37)-N1)-methyltransferase [Leptidea sinapis]|uniref:tRNA (guanine(37)-N1)-methyltransferase n=1 Tax=Leptidea sinapis TaxID=189913 RepID=UPI0021C25AEB|nr:tRNA (guanine(37)-N1)-methyltransferase [Leptidea sinapis]